MREIRSVRIGPLTRSREQMRIITLTGTEKERTSNFIHTIAFSNLMRNMAVGRTTIWSPKTFSC